MLRTGIHRKTDRNGRMVIPIELQESLHIHPGDSVAILTDGKTWICLEKYSGFACCFCKHADPYSLEHFNGKWVCLDCLATLKEQCSDEGPASHPENDTFEENGQSLSVTERHILRLQKEMKKRRNAKQKELAEALGISQGRVSQLMKIIKKG